MPETACDFREQISSHLLSVIQAFEEYYPELDQRAVNAWIMRLFSVPDNTIPDALVQMKMELLKLREDSQLRADFQAGESLVSVWAGLSSAC